jgi:glycosyltransferase involved in cell wall biosynthesis
MSEKVRILVLPSDRSGVGKFRSVDPHVCLQKLYPNEVHVDIEFEVNYDDKNFWKKYDIVHFHRLIGQNYEKSVELINWLNKEGVITICDIDDYWLPTKEHPLHSIIMEEKINLRILSQIKAASCITTTTEIFAKEVSKFNKNVYILPNAIDPNEPQFNEKTLESDKIRIGWLGGSSHLHDLYLMDGLVNKLSDINKDLQWVLCGFDTRGTMTEFNKETGEKKVRDIRPEETVWVKYEEIFTNNYKTVSDGYRSHLMRFKDEEYSNELNESYRRVWTKPTTSYARNYSKFDISLAPLKDHIFNRVKSQLKVIEAGFYKKALIASNIGPYTIDLKHSLSNGNFVDGNALLVNESRNHSDWAKSVKKLYQNPNMIKDMGERLYETVSKKYDLNIVTKNRKELYFGLLKK